ncbi:MAG: tetratricopeptide repeat protein [Prevotella sp.]|nr:tetratricopeptide repeat protein [Prevotella sp.]
MQHKWIQQLRDLAKQTGNDYYQSLAHMTMGQNLFYEGDREKGIQNVTEAIDLMAKTDRENTDHLIHGYLNMLASMYGETKDYDNALKTNERNLQLTMEGTRWGAAPNQQLIDRRMALAKMASVLAQKGRSASGRLQAKYYQQADSAYDAWKAVEYEGNHTRDYFIVDYMKKRGRYQEAVTIYNNLIQRVRQQGDTLGEMINTAKWGLAEVYQRMGNCEQAAILYEQVLEIQDTLKSRKAKHTAQELAAVYREQEQEETIMQQQAENTRQHAFLLIELLALFGVIALAVIVIVKNRIINLKNHALIKLIDEYIKLKSHSQPLPVKNGSASSLFTRLSTEIREQQLYLDPLFDRQAVCDRFSLTAVQVGNAFAQGSDYDSVVVLVTAIIVYLSLRRQKKAVMDEVNRLLLRLTDMELKVISNSTPNLSPAPSPNGEKDLKNDESGKGITPARNDANKCIEIVSIHVACQAVHRLIDLVLHQPLAPQFTFLVFVHGLYDLHAER